MTTTTTPNLALADLPQADQTAIIGTLMALQQGFARRDADALGAVYAPDADWVNAFGTTKHGAVDIVDHLRGLFADVNFDAGTVVSGPEIEIRVLTKDVVAVSAHLVVEGQGLIGGGTLHRDNYSLRILQRGADGSWPIVSEMFMDANTVATYAGHQ
jgi:uncharacterized protein (TIGR02246 family)